MKNWTDLVISLVLFVVCGVVWQQTTLLPETSSGVEFFRPASFPRGVACLLGALSLLLLIRTLRGTDTPAQWPAWPILRKVLLMILLVLGYVTLFIYGGEMAYDLLLPEGSGFCAATFVFLVLAQLLMGYRRIAPIVLLSGTMTAALYAIFGLLFKVPLP